MPTAPSSIIDGSPAYGIQTFTFSASGPYTAENMVISRPVQTARDRTSLGYPQNSRYTKDFVSMTATLQVPGNLAIPVFGETITGTFDAAYGVETFILMEVPFEASNDPSTLRKVNVTLEKKNQPGALIVVP